MATFIIKKRANFRPKETNTNEIYQFTLHISIRFYKFLYQNNFRFLPYTLIHFTCLHKISEEKNSRIIKIKVDYNVFLSFYYKKSCFYWFYI